MEEGYKVKLDIFEGPLDLLLYLIKREELDIYDIPIEKITRQYLEYLELMKMLDLNIAGEFLVVAATLMHIKSRMLLPPEEQGEEEEEEEEDPRWELVRQLIEYKKFKEAAEVLEERGKEQERTFPRFAEEVPPPEEEGLPLREVSIFALLSAFSSVLEKTGDAAVQEVFSETHTVAEKIESILEGLVEKGRVRFRELFRGMALRPEVVVTFLALLELIRQKRVRARQAEHFGEIEIVPATA